MKRSYDEYSNASDLDKELLNLKKPKKDNRKEYYTESDFEDEYDDDFYGDEEDRKYLDSLDELSKEEIINKRFEKRENLKERKRNAISKGLFRSSRSEALSKKSKQKSALSDLKEKRARQTRRQTRSQKKVSPKKEYYNDEVDEEEQEEEAPFEVKLDINSISRILISRKLLEKWYCEPYFEDLVVGTFVKVLIGEESNGMRAYRLAYVDAVKKKREYKFAGSSTRKYLTLRHADTLKTFPMDRISNQNISHVEFNYWKSEMEKQHREPPTMDDINKKYETIKNIGSYKYSGKDISKRIKERKYENLPMVSLSSEKMVLENKKSILEMDGDQESQEYYEVCNELEKVERLLRKKSSKPKVESSISIINKKNKSMNRKKKTKKVKKDSSVLDPFARKRTQSSLFFGLDSVEKKKEVTKNEEKVILSPGASLEQQHNFDLGDFMSTYEKLKKDAMPKKKKAKYAPIGTKNGNDEKNGGKKKKSLSLLDYKRRRGLIE